MYTPQTIRVTSFIAIVLSALALAISIFLAKQVNGIFFLGMITWIILLWASILGYKLSSYKLYEEEYKKVGIRIYLILIAFILFFFVGLIAGFVLSIILLATLWGLKRNYDEWENSEETVEDNRKAL